MEHSFAFFILIFNFLTHLSIRSWNPTYDSAKAYTVAYVSLKKEALDQGQEGIQLKFLLECIF